MNVPVSLPSGEVVFPNLCPWIFFFISVPNLCRGLPDPVLPDAGVRRDPALLPRDVSRAVHICRRTRRLEAHANDER